MVLNSTIRNTFASIQINHIILIKLKTFIILSVSAILLAFTTPEADVSVNSLFSLFKIERSKDANQIFYDVNVDQSGTLDKKNPINIYWRRYTEGGTIKPLTWIQKKYAYGLKYLNVKDEQATFQFVSYNKMLFTLRKTADNQFEVYTQSKGDLLKMNRIFINIDGGSFWFPKISTIEIYAQNIKTGEEVIEVIRP